MKTNKNTPIYIIIGTRAQLIKMGPIMKLMEDQHIPYAFIYTQQHKVTIKDLIENFDIKTPYVNLIERKEEAKSIRLFAGWGIQMLLKLLNPFSRKKILKNGRGLVITHGDTATASWAAIFGQTSFCKVLHIESGLRSYNLLKPFPEEIMRLITFAFSNYYVCPNEWAVNNLKWFPGKKINVGANPMYDSLMFALKKIDSTNLRLDELNLPKKYALVSIHRYENLFNKERFEKILQILEKISNKHELVIPLHPVTKEHLEKTGNMSRLKKNKRIKLLPRQDFLNFVALNAKSEFVITDGGSNQEEMSYIGKPTLLMRDVTERTEGIGENIVLSKYDEKIIWEFVKNYKKYERPPLKIKERPSKLAVEFIKKIINERKK